MIQACSTGRHSVIRRKDFVFPHATQACMPGHSSSGPVTRAVTKPPGCTKSRQSRLETALKPKKQNPCSAISNGRRAHWYDRGTQGRKKARKKYRERAAKMLTLAKKARTEDARASYLHLAASWDAPANGGHNQEH